MTSADRSATDPGSARELADIARALAERAGTMALQGRRTTTVTATEKSTPTDMVTMWDTASERLIVEGLGRSRPHDGIIGEEGSNTPGTSGITWHIDPIDGTSNFLYDLPTWAVSIGACDAHGPLAGAVYIPVLNEMYVAARGAGATCNGSPIRASDRDDLSTAMVGTGFAYEPARRVRQGRVVGGIVGRVRDIRRLGAASVDICFVACGRLDAYFEEGLHSWDLMAAQVIATEAGAVATDFDGGPIEPDRVVVAAPGIHRAFVALLGSTTVGDQ